MARLTSIVIYPDKEAPGQALTTSYVSPDGLDGDRRKKSPVHLVAVESYVDEHPRANLVVDMPSDALAGLVGRRLRLGTVELDVTSLAGNCAGVYARVPFPGDLSVGDELLVADASG
jgi:uncharacterized protein YcbX